MPANGQPDLWVEGAQTLRVTEVQALVKYATEVRGSWVTIELGSTASLTNSEETLESVSDELYQRLTKQLKALWANNKAGGNETQAEALVSRSPERSEGEAKGQTNSTQRPLGD